MVVSSQEPYSLGGLELVCRAYQIGIVYHKKGYVSALDLSARKRRVQLSGMSFSSC